jgi:hypothetical protein
MDPGGKQTDQSSRGHVMTCHVVRSFDRAAVQQFAYYHQACAVRGGDQKRPDRQFPKAHLHPNPSRMAMSHEGIDSETDQECGDEVADNDDRQSKAEQRGCQNYGANGHCVADRNRKERILLPRCPLALHPQRHREKPPMPGLIPW